MTGPKGNIKIIPGETAADPVTTNYSSGADIYKEELNSKTNFIQKIKPLILSGSGGFFKWEGMNIHNRLSSVNMTNTLHKQKNPDMDITPQMVSDTIYSPWIQTIAAEYRKAGIVKSGSQILNEQGEAWAKETGQKWTPIDYVTEADLNNARARARRDLEQIYNHSATEQVNQAHLNHQKGEPYQLNPYAISRDAGNHNFLENRGTHQHAGEDTKTPQRTPILATRDGVIVNSGFTGTAGGGEIFIDNGGGYDSRVLHMNEIAVQPGQRVTKGTFLGYSGGEIGTKGAGRSTGPHGHWEIRKNGQLLDPMSTDSNGILLDQFFGYGE